MIIYNDNTLNGINDTYLVSGHLSVYVIIG